MHSDWYVSSNYICGEYMYIAMRTRNINEVKHSGNVETYGEYSTDKEEIQKLVDELNKSDH